MNGTITISIDDYESMKNENEAFKNKEYLELKELQQKIDALTSGGGFSERQNLYGWSTIQTVIFTSDQMKKVIDKRIETIKKSYINRGLWERILNKEPE